MLQRAVLATKMCEKWREMRSEKRGETRGGGHARKELDENYREFLYVVLAVPLLSSSGRLDAGSRWASKCNESQGVAQD